MSGDATAELLAVGDELFCLRCRLHRAEVVRLGDLLFVRDAEVFAMRNALEMILHEREVQHREHAGAWATSFLARYAVERARVGLGLPPAADR